ncbi:MAG: hypothetical protein IH983_04200 [Planctomycetes bacterium]|nr:hypothetical protein [Planctomycetota bacterium]
MRRVARTPKEQPPESGESAVRAEGVPVRVAGRFPTFVYTKMLGHPHQLRYFPERVRELLDAANEVDRVGELSDPRTPTDRLKEVRRLAPEVAARARRLARAIRDRCTESFERPGELEPHPEVAINSELAELNCGPLPDLQSAVKFCEWRPKDSFPCCIVRPLSNESREGISDSLVQTVQALCNLATRTGLRSRIHWRPKLTAQDIYAANIRPDEPARLEVLANSLEEMIAAATKPPRQPAHMQRSAIEGEWSKPMTKKELKKRLGGVSNTTFSILAAQFGLDQINRQTFRIRLDTMDAGIRRGFEEAS